jgi:hypothetical protein
MTCLRLDFKGPFLGYMLEFSPLNDFLFYCFFKPYDLGGHFSALCHFFAALFYDFLVLIKS